MLKSCTPIAVAEAGLEKRRASLAQRHDAAAVTLAARFLARQAGRLAFVLLSAWIAVLVEVGARDLARRTVERALCRCKACARALNW